MGSYFFDPSIYPGDNSQLGPRPLPSSGTEGGYPGETQVTGGQGEFPFGPIFSPPSLPPRTDTDRSRAGVDRGGGETQLVRYFDPGALRRFYETPEIPLPGGRDMGGFLPGIVFPGQIDRGGLLTRIGGAILGGFLPQAPDPCTIDPPAGQRGTLPCMFTGPQIGTTIPQLGNAVTSVVRRAAGVPVCTYPTKGGKQRGGKYAIVNGQLVCVPKPRRMSPCNPHAARRAVRRLNMVHSFMRSIEKSMAKACRPSHPRRAAGGKCGTCRKTKCSC